MCRSKIPHCSLVRGSGQVSLGQRALRGPAEGEGTAIASQG